MTAIRGYVAPTAEADALGVHSLDQFVLAVPDASVAQEFYGLFGLDVRTNGNTLELKTFGHDHRWGSVVEGPVQIWVPPLLIFFSDSHRKQYFCARILSC